MSYLEFVGVITGGIAVWLSAKGNIWSWPVGIVNVTLIFFLVFQVQLYPDMFLPDSSFSLPILSAGGDGHIPRKERKTLKWNCGPSWMEARWLVILAVLTISGVYLFGDVCKEPCTNYFRSFFPCRVRIPTGIHRWQSPAIVATYLMVEKKNRMLACLACRRHHCHVPVFFPRGFYFSALNILCSALLLLLVSGNGKGILNYILREARAGDWKNSCRCTWAIAP